jgi:hypothetical protein
MVWRTRISWAVFLAGGLWGASVEGIAPDPHPPWVRALAAGYVAWSLYWGLPAMWRRRRALLERLRAWISSKNQLTKWAICESIFWTWAFLFSVLGGGLHQFAQAVRMRRGASPRRPLTTVLGSSSARTPTSRP